MLGHSFGGFLAPILINFFPWIPRLPVKALQTDGVAKQIAKQLAGRLLKENQVGSHNQGRDILSLLVEDNRKKAAGEAKLTDEQLLDNVSIVFYCPNNVTDTVFRSLPSCEHEVCLLIYTSPLTIIARCYTAWLGM